MTIWHIFYYTTSSIEEDKLYKIIGYNDNHCRRVIREMIQGWIVSRDDGILYMKPFYKYQLSNLLYKDKIIKHSIAASQMLLNYYLNIVDNITNDWTQFIKELPDILNYMSIISGYDEPEFILHIRKIYYPCRYHYHHITIAASVILEKLYKQLEQKVNVSELLSDIRFRIGQLKFYLCDNRGALVDYEKASNTYGSLDKKNKAIFDLYRAEILMYETVSIQTGKELLRSSHSTLNSYDCIDTARAKRLFVSKIMREMIARKYENNQIESELIQYYLDGERELKEAEDICIKEKNYFELCYVLRNWGEWLIVCSKCVPSKKQMLYERANNLYKESQYYANKYSFKYALAHVSIAYGEIYKIMNQFDSAIVEYENAYYINKELCEYQGQGHAVKDQADIFTEWYKRGNSTCYDIAYQKYTEAINLYKKAKDDRALGYGYLHRALLQGINLKKEAIRDIHEAIKIFRTGQLDIDERRAMVCLDKIEGGE
jgi:hypothetical protein